VTAATTITMVSAFRFKQDLNLIKQRRIVSFRSDRLTTYQVCK
jgi:hypothetical protein